MLNNECISQNLDTINVRQYIEIHTDGELSLLQGKTKIPGTLIRTQEIIDLDITISTNSSINFFDFQKGANKYANITIRNPGPKFQIQVDYSAILSNYDLLAAKSNPQNLELDDRDRKKYLKSKQFINYKNGFAKKNLPSFEAENEIQLVQEIYHFVQDTIKFDPLYKYRNYDKSIKHTLTNGIGDCTEFARLMIALCRKSGVPAKEIYGFMVIGGERLARHNWVEVYFNDYGWVTFDPTTGNAISFEELKHKYLKLSEGTVYPDPFTTWEKTEWKPSTFKRYRKVNHGEMVRS